MSDTTKAVFLSYARDDAAAARRIADALRSAGVEVWFDENELRGGDAWDAKIRRQIDACALFIPVISQHTQDRSKGYFRLEWKLAVDQTHLLAAGVPFIAPVVIDGTREAEAIVPPEFMKVQWTRLAGALPTPEFVAQVRRLLAEPQAPAASATVRAGGGHSDKPAVPSSRPKIARWLWVGGIAALAAVGSGLWSVRQSIPPTGGSPSPAPAAARDASVAVLAFANLSDDKGNEYFSDGVSEELLNVLAKVPGLKVSARTSAFFFKGKQVPIAEIAQKLGVAYVVEGSVQRAGDRVKITAQLIKAADGFHLWSETYTRDMKDIFSVQDEIAGKIASALTARLGMTLPATAKTTPEAYTIYLQARATLAKRGTENLRQAAQLFERVLALDPDYLPARSGLAITLGLIPAWSRSLALGENRAMVDRGIAGARLVIGRDPGNAEAWSALGYLYGLYEWKWKEAGEAVERSLALAPNDAEIVNFAGDYYRFVLDRRKAIELEKRAVELNPLHAVNHLDLAFCYIAFGLPELALVPARTAISLAPEILESYEALTMALGRLRRYEEIHAVLASARAARPPGAVAVANIERALAIHEGRLDEARRLQEAFTRYVEHDGASPSEHGFYYLLLGDAEMATRWLRRGVAGRDSLLVSAETIDFEVLAANPLTRSILDEPALQELWRIRRRNARMTDPRP